MKKLLQKVKNEKGLTLIELLAVVVILGIIAAIAVPSIGGIIDNSKKDAHVANATQMISAAKLAVTGDRALQPTVDNEDVEIYLQNLIADGYMESFSDPDGGNYVDGAGTVEGNDLVGSYVIVSRDSATGSYAYEVQLVGSERQIPRADEGSFDRGDVEVNP